VNAIEHGQGDWIFALIPYAQYRELRLQNPALLRSNPLFAVDFADLNTHRPPFNDIRDRQALNYAIDRNKLAELYGGPSFATPTCQPLAPGLPGYRRYCPYTLHPLKDGAWTAPDPARAARLVSESGTKGEPVDIWGATDLAYVPTTVPTYIAEVVRSLGYRVRLHLARFATITNAIRRRSEILAYGDWQADYPDPSSYIPEFFACNGASSNGYHCNPRLDREMQQASLLEIKSPSKATALWTSIDHQLTDNAAWLATENLRDVELVSQRLGNYQYNPSWGFLADQAWLH
jgi:peptide/nickel transport system substrate-binding protein